MFQRMEQNDQIEGTVIGQIAPIEKPDRRGIQGQMAMGAIGFDRHQRQIRA